MQPFILIAAEGGLIEMARSTGEQFGFDRSLFVSQVISFLIVAFLLRRFAYRPILKVLEQRRQAIAETVANNAQIKEQLAQTEAARHKILADANVHASTIIEEARAAAAK